MNTEYQLWLLDSHGKPHKRMVFTGDNATPHGNWNTKNVGETWVKENVAMLPLGCTFVTVMMPKPPAPVVEDEA